jgi:hypothetical protein
VDVHVRRLRAKLGPEYEALIGTVRNVGYKAVRPSRGRTPAGGAAGTGEAAPDEGHGDDDFEPASEDADEPLAGRLPSQ